MENPVDNITKGVDKSPNFSFITILLFYFCLSVVMLVSFAVFVLLSDTFLAVYSLFCMLICALICMLGLVSERIH